MAEREIIELSSGDSDDSRPNDRRVLLQPAILRVVHALGGHEPDIGYRMGDEVGGCLKDLKKLWRTDDTDDERTVARIFWETRVLLNDLVPILLATAGKGLVEDKRAIACADLMTAMTWPIDMAEELKELDEELDKGTDYTQLLQSHLYYKAALLKPGIMQALFGIILAPLSKPLKERVERDGQVVNVVLHLIRNLAFIKDLPFNTHLSADQAEFSSLQSKLIRALADTHILKLLLTIAANTDNDPLLSGWNTLVLEIFYLLFRGTKPSALALDQAKQPTQTLHRLLAAEARTRNELSRKASSRHSRFGTTIAVRLNPNRKTENGDLEPPAGAESDLSSTNSRSFVLHRQQAINREAASIMDITKRQTAKKGHKADEMTREDNLSMEARNILRGLAIEFVEACFNPFLAALLKDIRMERTKITEKDNLRLMFVTKWFLEFFLSLRKRREHGADKTAEVDKKQNHDLTTRWGFGLIAEVTEHAWIVWILKRMRGAVEEKPKQWTELQTGIECLTQLLLIIDAMSSPPSSNSDPENDSDGAQIKEAAEILCQQIIYNGEVLDIAFESLRAYKPGTQSLVYLDSSVYMGYALMKVLEKWGKNVGGENTYVRKKKKGGTRQRRDKGGGDGEEIPDVEDEVEEDNTIHEILFTFEAFEAKLAHADITHTLLVYLARYKEFTSSECMRRVVSLMHRQAVRAKAEGLFFKVSTLDLFKTLLADQRSFPRDQPYKDLVNLITFILRQFFKALAEEPFLAIETFYPKNRGHWKQFSSWEPESKSKKVNEKRTVEDTRFPQDVEVKKGYSWSDQLGISIAALVEAGQVELVDWTKTILAVAIQQRERLIEEIGEKAVKETPDADDDDLESATARRLAQPSNEAIAQFKDYLIPYLSDEQADAATKNPHLKLLFRLSKFFILDEDADELEWYIPAAILPSDLKGTLNVINQFLDTPFDLEGKKASQLLTKRRRRRRRLRSPSPSATDPPALSDDDKPRRGEKKKREEKQYKSAQFIQDSDEEYGDMEGFLEREKKMRERIQKAAEAAGDGKIGTMKLTGTKKRRRKGKQEPTTSKKHKGQRAAGDAIDSGDSDEDGGRATVRHPTPAKGSSAESDSTEHEPLLSSVNPDLAAAAFRPAQPRPRPRPIRKSAGSASPTTIPLQSDDSNVDSGSPHRPGSEENNEQDVLPAHVKRSRVHLVISDDESE